MIALEPGPGSRKLLRTLEEAQGDVALRFSTPNGWGLSIIRVMPPSGEPQGGSDGAREGLYEIGLLKHGHLCMEGPILRDPVGHQSPLQVVMTLREVFELPPAPAE